jgi:transposase
MAVQTPSRLAAVIGLDWADQKHHVSLQETGSKHVEQFELPHTPEALTAWVGSLQRRFPEQALGIAVETSRGPVVHALMDYDFLVLYPVNPRSLRRFRQAFYPSGSKDDVPDADLLRELLQKHRDRLHAWVPDDAQTRALRRLVQSRRRLVELRTQLVQQLTAALKEYFPQALAWAGEDLSSPLACSFLLKWPSLQCLQRARPQTIRNFYYAHNCRHAERIEARIQQIEAAAPLTRDAAILDSSVVLVQALARQLKALAPSLARFDRQIKARFEAHEDAELFRSLPGSGAALAPRLLVAFGSRRDRFLCAGEIQVVSGIAPVTERSGKTSYVHWRWSASTFVRQSFHEFAHHSIRFCDWAKAYYDIQRDKGKEHHAAVRALAFKWIRILWRCWTDQTHYDEAHYVASLHRNGSPVAHRLTASPPLQPLQPLHNLNP